MVPCFYLVFVFYSKRLAPKGREGPKNAHRPGSIADGRALGVFKKEKRKKEEEWKSK